MPNSNSMPLRKMACIGFNGQPMNGFAQLQAAASDAQKWAAFAPSCGFTAKLLTDEHPQKAPQDSQAVLNWIKEQVADLHENDLFVLYLTTHSFCVSNSKDPTTQPERVFTLPGTNTQHLMALLAEPTAQAFMANPAFITLKQLKAATAKPGLCRLFILETCHKLISNRSSLVGAPKSPMGFIDRGPVYSFSFRRADGRRTLTLVEACSAGESAKELVEAKTGSFTQAALAELKAHLDASRSITFDREMLAAIGSRIARIFAGAGNSTITQTPEINGPGFALLDKDSVEGPVRRAYTALHRLDPQSDPKSLRDAIQQADKFLKLHASSAFGNAAVELRGRWETLLEQCLRKQRLVLAILGVAAVAITLKMLDIDNRAQEPVNADCSGCPSMVRLPDGEVTLRTAAGQPGRSGKKEAPQVVAITGLMMSETEITFDEWNACVKAGGCAGNRQPNDYGFGRSDRPVIDVTFDDALAYIKWLKEATGHASYRLPLEHEWEYAARATTQRADKPGTPLVAADQPVEASQVRFMRSGSRTHGTGSVREFPANAFKIYGMYGNVWEMTASCFRYERMADRLADAADIDCLHIAKKGGAWNSEASSLKAEERRPWFRGTPDREPEAMNDVGFRVVRLAKE